MNKIRKLLIAIPISIAFAFPVLAQEAEVTEAPPLPEVVPPDQSDVEVVEGEVVINPAVEEQLETTFTNLVKLLWNAAYLPFAVPFVTVLTALSKRLPVKVSSPVWAFGWTIIVWLVYLAATQFGFANQFETVISSLATVGATFLGITVTPALASGLHGYANAKNVAFVGYSKTPQAGGAG